MSYKNRLQTNNNNLEGNNVDLQSILNTINELPEATSGISCNTCTIMIADDAYREDSFPTISCTILENNTIHTVTETITSDYKQINNVVCGSTAVISPAEGMSLYDDYQYVNISSSNGEYIPGDINQAFFVFSVLNIDSLDITLESYSMQPE